MKSGGSDSKGSPCNVGDLGSIPGLERSQGKGMAACSSILAWRSPWTEQPDGLQSMGPDMTERLMQNTTHTWGQGWPHRFLLPRRKGRGCHYWSGEDCGKDRFLLAVALVEIKSLVSDLGSESNFTVYPVAVIKLTLQNAHRSMTCARLTFSSSWISKV